ncbi:MAG TPA: hypothetical protein VMB72_03970, partial [Acidimicrobiales bacterium]|nr:hypothetical protein [Acidimicrobiales bacterium]
MPGPHPLGHPDPASPGATALDTGPPSAAPGPGGNGGAARSGGGAGGAGEGGQARPVRPPGPSTKPALVVLGVVLLVFVLGV